MPKFEDSKLHDSKWIVTRFKIFFEIKRFAWLRCDSLDTCLLFFFSCPQTRSFLQSLWIRIEMIDKRYSKIPFARFTAYDSVRPFKKRVISSLSRFLFCILCPVSSLISQFSRFSQYRFTFEPNFFFSFFFRFSHDFSRVFFSPLLRERKKY